VRLNQPLLCRQQLRECEKSEVVCSAVGKEVTVEGVAAETKEISPALRSALGKLSIMVFGVVCGCQASGYLAALPSSFLLASAICFYSWAKQSLSTSGLISAWFVYVLTHVSSVIVSAQLLAFFISSSKWTEFKSSTKDKFTVENKKGGRRNWIQVLCNGGWPTLFAVLFAQSIAFSQSNLFSTTALSNLSVFFFGCCLGSYSCCCGDTWASEIGVLSKAEPRLITTLRKVPRGTNGGVSALGLLASAFGGLLIGVTTFLMSLFTIQQPLNQQVIAAQLPLILLGTTAGFVGSVVDSLLGATLQFSGLHEQLQKVVNRPGDPSGGVITRITGVDILSNNQVNLVSSFITAIFIGALSILFLS